MSRLVLLIEDSHMTRLREMAMQKGVSVAAIVRKAIVAFLDTDLEQRVRDLEKEVERLKKLSHHHDK